MCGILGGNNIDWNYKKGILSMRHRGPDDQRIIQFDKFILAFARLAIIDLSSKGMQPMFSEGEDICIVFNGEIYGYKQLRNDLTERGYKFNTLSDTEVIINAYLEWGDDFINHIDGMFAFALYDRRCQLVKLYRDRVGIKPLYYYYDGKNFVFSSELKGIVETCDNTKLQTDDTAIYDYINYLYIPEPKTMYKNVYKLAPASKLVFDLRKSKIRSICKFWVLNVNENRAKERKQEELIEELKGKIHKSVEQQMVADVKVGTFLSGGVDSSIITYESSTINNNTEAFSMGFTDRRVNEIDYATKLAQRYKIPINLQIVDNEIFDEIYKKLPEWYTEPFGDTSAYPSYLVSKMAKQNVTVVLTGDGGDEVFGGYERYKFFANLCGSHKLNNEEISRLYEYTFIKKLLPTFDKYLLEDIALIMPLFFYQIKPNKKELRNRFNIPNDYDDYWYYRKYYNPKLPWITRMQYLDFNTYLPSDILTKVDRVSMAVSLETRVPFLSREIIEFSFGLSQEDRCPKGELKGLLKKAYCSEISKELAYRKKQGFSIPKGFIKDNISTQEKLLKDLWKI